MNKIKQNKHFHLSSFQEGYFAFFRTEPIPAAPVVSPPIAVPIPAAPPSAGPVIEPGQVRPDGQVDVSEINSFKPYRPDLGDKIVYQPVSGQSSVNSGLKRYYLATSDGPILFIGGEDKVKALGADPQKAKEDLQGITEHSSLAFHVPKAWRRTRLSSNEGIKLENDGFYYRNGNSGWEKQYVNKRRTSSSNDRPIFFTGNYKEEPIKEIHLSPEYTLKLDNNGKAHLVSPKTGKQTEVPPGAEIVGSNTIIVPTSEGKTTAQSIEQFFNIPPGTNPNIDKGNIEVNPITKPSPEDKPGTQVDTKPGSGETDHSPPAKIVPEDPKRVGVGDPKKLSDGRIERELQPGEYYKKEGGKIKIYEHGKPLPKEELDANSHVIVRQLRGDERVEKKGDKLFITTKDGKQIEEVKPGTIIKVDENLEIRIEQTGDGVRVYKSDNKKGIDTPVNSDGDILTVEKPKQEGRISPKAAIRDVEKGDTLTDINGQKYEVVEAYESNGVQKVFVKDSKGNQHQIVNARHVNQHSLHDILVYGKSADGTERIGKPTNIETKKVWGGLRDDITTIELAGGGSVTVENSVFGEETWNLPTSNSHSARENIVNKPIAPFAPAQPAPSPNVSNYPKQAAFDNALRDKLNNTSAEVELTVGRNPTPGVNDFVLDSPVISGRHAVLRVKTSSNGTREYSITDTSTNGTLVNGKRIPTGVEYTIRARDTITFGPDVHNDTIVFTPPPSKTVLSVAPTPSPTPVNKVQLDPKLLPTKPNEFTYVDATTGTSLTNAQTGNSEDPMLLNPIRAGGFSKLFNPALPDSVEVPSYGIYNQQIRDPKIQKQIEDGVTKESARWYMLSRRLDAHAGDYGNAFAVTGFTRNSNGTFALTVNTGVGTTQTWRYSSTGERIP